jgi:hypothetical protein
VCKTLLPLTQIVLFDKKHVFPISSQEGISHKVTDSPTSKCFQITSILFQANSKLTGKNVLDHRASNIDGFLAGDTVLLPFT